MVILIPKNMIPRKGPWGGKSLEEFDYRVLSHLFALTTKNSYFLAAVIEGDKANVIWNLANKEDVGVRPLSEVLEYVEIISELADDSRVTREKNKEENKKLNLKLNWDEEEH